MFNHFKDFIKTIKDAEDVQQVKDDHALEVKAGKFKWLVVKTLNEYLPYFSEFHANDIRYAESVWLPELGNPGMFLFGIKIKNVMFLFEQTPLETGTLYFLHLANTNESTFYDDNSINLRTTSCFTTELFVANFLKDHCNFTGKVF